MKNVNIEIKKEKEDFIKKLYICVTLMMDVSLTTNTIPELEDVSNQLLILCTKITEFMSKHVDESIEINTNIKDISQNLTEEEIEIVNKYKNIFIEKMDI
jgi:dimeric dUTPase (all-alpha-NTP-PPase superfamily)